LTENESIYYWYIKKSKHTTNLSCEQFCFLNLHDIGRWSFSFIKSFFLLSDARIAHGTYIMMKPFNFLFIIRITLIIRIKLYGYIIYSI